jgi:hypothetical protein
MGDNEQYDDIFLYRYFVFLHIACIQGQMSKAPSYCIAEMKKILLSST